VVTKECKEKTGNRLVRPLPLDKSTAADARGFDQQQRKLVNVLSPYHIDEDSRIHNKTKT